VRLIRYRETGEVRDDVVDATITRAVDREKALGREERDRTVISGMEPRRIAVVMLLPRK
jgi:hypothetical protein